MKLRQTLPAFVLLVTTMASADGKDADQWVQLKRPPVAMIATGADSPQRVSGQIERVRSIFATAFPNVRSQPREPLVVVAVNGERKLRELLPQYWERSGEHPIAAYWRGPYRHCIVLRSDASERELFRRVLHEYVHMLTHVNVSDPAPWLNEGLSEFWSTATIQDDVLEVGSASRRHIQVLRSKRPWIPWPDLLGMSRVPDASEKRKLALFYAQSWVLLHYLMLSDAAQPLSFLPHRQPADVAGLESQLEAYVRRGQFRAVRIPVPREATDRGLTEPIPTSRALATAAGCVADGERPAAATPLLMRALALNPNEIPALETFGYVRFLQNEPQEAAKWFDRAISTGSAGHLPYFYRAILAGIPGSGSHPTASAADNLNKAIALDPTFAPAYARLAALQADAGRVSEALPLLRRALELDPGNSEYRAELERWTNARPP